MRGAVIVGGESLHPLERALDRGAVELQSLRQLGQRRLGGLAAGVRHEADDVRLLLQSTVGVEPRDRVELATGGSHGPLQVG